MLQLLPQNKILTPNSVSANEASEFICNYIEKYHCEILEIDISELNIIDACYVSTICSAKHFIKYPKGKINWKISSALTEEFTASLNLGNSIYSY